MGVVDGVGIAAGAVAMEGFVDADVEDVVVAGVLEAGACGDGVAGAAEAVVADGEEVEGGDAFPARADGGGETFDLADGELEAGFEEVLVGDGVVVFERGGGAEGGAALDAVGAAVHGDVVAVGVEGEVVGDAAIAHPLHDGAPAAGAGLDGVVDGGGGFDDGGAGAGVGGVLDVVVAGGDVDAEADGGVAFGDVLGIEEPGVDADDGVAETGGLVLDGRALLFARGEEPGGVDLNADARGDLVGEVEGDEVDAVFDLGFLLGAVLLIDVADVVLVGELVALADGELEVAGLEDAALIGGKAGLLGAAREDAALSAGGESGEKQEGERQGEERVAGRVLRWVLRGRIENMRSVLSLQRDGRVGARVREQRNRCEHCALWLRKECGLL